MSKQSKALAESICLLFGKAYKRDGDPAQGGIEDKVLTDVIMLIGGMLRAHYGPLEARIATLEAALRHEMMVAISNGREGVVERISDALAVTATANPGSAANEPVAESDGRTM